MIVNLSQAVDRQRERLELMRTFTHWRLQHSEAREQVRDRGVRGLPQRARVWLRWGAVGTGHCILMSVFEMTVHPFNQGMSCTCLFCEMNVITSLVNCTF